jgi:hypothetical protein
MANVENVSHIYAFSALSAAFLGDLCDSGRRTKLRIVAKKMKSRQSASGILATRSFKLPEFYQPRFTPTKITRLFTHLRNDPKLTRPALTAASVFCILS